MYARNIDQCSPAPISQLAHCFHFLKLYKNLFVVLVILVSLNSITVNVPPPYPHTLLASF